MADDPQDLLRLADEVAAATGPDRRLDALIWCIVGNELGYDDPPHRHRLMRPLQPRICIMGRWLGSALEKYPDDIEGIAHNWRVPAFTGSHDAAMSLIPAWLTPTITGHEQSCRLLNGIGFPVRGMDHFTRAATLPLAITAAALKARAHSTKENTHVG